MKQKRFKNSGIAFLSLSRTYLFVFILNTPVFCVALFALR